MQQERKKFWAEKLLGPLYDNQYLETLWNARTQFHRDNGWKLKGGQKSPWFLNLRPIGSSPRVYFAVWKAMSELIYEFRDCFEILIGIEMAGVSPLGFILHELVSTYQIYKKIGYTRPLEKKVRTPEELLKILGELRTLYSYGEKHLVEAVFYPGSRIALLDDMVTNIGSKIIARCLVFEEAKKQDVSVSCNHIFCLLNRDPKNYQKTVDFAFAKEENLQLYPDKLELHCIMEFNESLPLLRDHMATAEYEIISEYQEDPSRFQDPDVWERTLEKARKTSPYHI